MTSLGGTVRVLYFAAFREKMGLTEEDVTVAGRLSVNELLAVLAAKNPWLADFRGKYRVAVNQCFVHENDFVKPGDEVALIPPVAGGSLPWVEVSDQPLSLDRLIAVVKHPSCGAVCTFTGMVRDHSSHGDVTKLSYEAYQAMAEKALRDICERTAAASPGLRVAVSHRVGELTIGDLAVVIACASPHRNEAFVACRRIIEDLKKDVPIWKKEFLQDGSHWVGLGS